MHGQHEFGFQLEHGIGRAFLQSFHIFNNYLAVFLITKVGFVLAHDKTIDFDLINRMNFKAGDLSGLLEQEQFTIAPIFFGAVKVMAVRVNGLGVELVHRYTFTLSPS
ncbi:hypothetical protein [Caudoviricetes sp.]|nr:hypothetical protein [Caudoviricetes sp.]UOF81107.1 hypothetical protein [Caudoviricetes sp.]UOF82212.1 hypothetical protein [Caudoviricetes sp.]UOF82452.1 hypothetical protein [Caudoviricetes sp.]UOF82651.1 hypothetical protein [Caudoviricetes sp.]